MIFNTIVHLLLLTTFYDVTTTFMISIPYSTLITTKPSLTKTYFHCRSSHDITLYPRDTAGTTTRLMFFTNKYNSLLRISLCDHRRRLNTNKIITTTTTTQSNMVLIPLDVNTLERIISSSGKPTGAQYATYWGRTMKERYGRTIESATVGFLGVFFSYFLSFIVGGFIATILGSLFFFWGILSPELKAYQRNWEFLGGRQLVDLDIVNERRMDPEQAGLYGGLFVGHIADVCVVEDTNDIEDDEYDMSDFSDYTMETDELDRFTGQPYLLRLQCTDRLGRTLQIHTRLSEDYLGLKPGMPSTTLLLSTSPSFNKLAALTDVFVLTTDKDDVDDIETIAGCWIGDYPYLDRIEFEALLAEDDDLWDALQAEATTVNDELLNNSNYGNRTPQSDSTQDGNDYDDHGYDRNKVLLPSKGRRQR
jgi:hypothetical protein